MKINKINIKEKFDRFSEHWTPKIIAQLNNQDVKLAKVKGTFVWHSHEEEDEMFFIIKGRLKIEFRDHSVELGPGEMVVVPKGVEHRPVANEEVWLMLFEPSATKHTGNVIHELTVDQLEKI